MTDKNSVTLTLAEINLYRQGLGLKPLSSLFAITEGSPTQYLASLKKQWAEKLGGWKGELFTRFGLFSPMAIEQGTTADRQKRIETGLAWTPPTAPSPIPTPTSPKTISQLPKGVNLTGEQKFIGESEYEKGSDGKWYKLTAPDVVSVGGYDWVRVPDLTGKGEDTFDVIGKTTQQGMTEAEKAQLALEQSRFDFEKLREQWQAARDWTARENLTEWEKAQLGLREKESAFERERWQAEQSRLERQSTEEKRLLPERMALQYEIDRQRLIAGIPSDDWITQWVVKNQPNPYRQPTPANQIDQLESTLDRQTANVQYQENRLAEAITSGADAARIEEFRGYVTEAKKQRDATYGDWNTMRTEKKDWTPQPYPNAPEWLSKYAPGQVVGRMITPENVVTPSGQQLTQMPASTASKLGYFADWTAKMGGGRTWKDILGEAEIMQPRSPGFGRTRWSPTR